MANRNTDIELLAGLSEESFGEIVKDIKALQKRLEASGIKINIEANVEQLAMKVAKDITSSFKKSGVDIGKVLIDQFGVVDKTAQEKIKNLAKQLKDIRISEITTGVGDDNLTAVMKELGDVVINNSNIIQQRMGIYDEFYNYLKKIRAIKISDVVKADLGDDWNTLRQTYSSKFSTNKGIELDSIYQEMSTKFQSLFSGTANPADQFREITDAIRKYREDVNKIEPLDASSIGLEDSVFEAMIAELQKLDSIVKKTNIKESVSAITGEANSMDNVADSAKEASAQKEKFAAANRDVERTAENTSDAINRERNAMDSLDDVDTILNNVNMSGRQGNSVFQQFGNTLRNAFSAYTMVNFLEQGMQKVVDAGEEALKIVKEFDDINVNLQMATGEDKDYVKGLISDYAELGGELGALTQTVAESADTFLRQGRSMEEANQLIEDAVVLSKVAQTEGGKASEILTATINGFQLAATEGNRVNDVLSSIDLNSASSAEGIGTALTKVASMANNAGLSLGKTAAMIATIKDVTQDADTTIGTSLKTVLSRMNSIRAGKFIDEESGEALNDVEKVLGSIGVSMRAVNGQFKEAESIIDEVGIKWKTLDGNTQKAVTTAMGGTYQANKLVSLFDNYDKVLELTKVAEESTGVSLEKFNNSYLPSLEAKTNALRSSLEALATATISDELYATVLDATKAIVDMTTKTGILKGALAGLATSGAVYTFQHLTAYLRDATQEFANLGEAIQITRGANGTVTDMQRLIDLTGGLSQAQTRMLFSTSSLTDAQETAILINQYLAQGMDEDLARATAETTLRTWGLTAAQQGATGAAITLKNTIRGLWSTLLANPYVLITAAITAGITAFQLYLSAVEKAEKKLDDLKDTLQETKTELKNIDTELDNVNSQIDAILAKDKIEIVDENELKKLREEVGLLEEKKKLLEAQEYEQQQKTNRFISKMYNENYTTAIVTTPDGSIVEKDALSYFEELYKQAEKYVLSENPLTDEEKLNFESIKNGAVDLGLQLTDLLEDFKPLTAEEEKQKEAMETMLHYATEISDMYAGTSYEVGERLVEKFASGTDANSNKLISDWINSLSDEDKRIMLQCDLDEASLDELKSYLQEQKVEIDVDTDTLSNTKSKMIDLINSMSDGFDVLDKIYSDVVDKGAFDFTNLDSKKFQEAFAGLEDEYISFIEKVSATPTDIEACQEAFNDLTTAYINQKGILDNLTEENAQLTISMLKNMGVVNAEEVVMAQLETQTKFLALQKQFATEKGYELAEATITEAMEFINEANCSEVVKQALAQLALEKINVNNQQIDTSADIDNVIALANAAGSSAKVLDELARAKSVLAQVESSSASGMQFLNNGQYDKALKLIESIENGTYDFDYQKIDPDKFKVEIPKIKYTGGEDTLKALEKNAKDAKNEFKKDVDFFEERIKKLNNSISLLKSNLENVNGSFAKNNLLSAQSSIYQEEIKNYTDALAMYQQKADEVLSTLPDDIAEKIKNGSVSLTKFVGESSEVVVDAIKDYQGWSDKIADCNQQLAELKQTLEDLELAKFTNIIEDFKNMFDIRENSKDLLDKQIDLFKEAGLLVGTSLYDVQLSQSKKQLELLEQEKAKLVEQMNSALSSGRVTVGSEAFLSMIDSLGSVEESIVDVKTQIESLDNELLNLHYEVLEKVQDNFNNLHSEIDNILGLFEDLDVATKDNNWTSEGLTQLALLSEKYELAKYQSESYGSAIERLNQEYLSGKYSLLEYQEKLSDLNEKQWDAINTAESAKDSILSLNEARVNIVVDGINEEIDAYKELVDAQIEALSAEKDLHDYRKSIEETTKSKTDIEKKLAAMANDDSASAKAQKAKLREELAKINSELEEKEYDHSIEQQRSALETMYEDYEKTRNDEITALQESLKDQEQIIADSFESVKQNASLVGQQITQIAQEHGVKVSDALTSSWKQGENAIASYGTVLDIQSSAFIGNIIGVENEIWDLQSKANETSNSLAWMFSTQSDNLVSELAQSYYAEGNVLNMTNALQQSLVNTLERGYDVSNITTALKGIENAANSAANAISKLNDTNVNTPSVKYIVVDNSTSNQIKRAGTFNSADDAQAWIDKYGDEGYMMVRHATGYAKGVHNLKNDEIAWTQEKGREIVLSPSRNAVLTPLKAGDTVLTKVQTDNIFDWSKLKPIDVLPNLNIMSNLPKVSNKTVERPINVHYDSLVTVNGDVNDTNHFLKQVTAVAHNQIVDFNKDLVQAVMYGNGLNLKWKSKQNI